MVVAEHQQSDYDGEGTEGPGLTIAEGAQQDPEGEWRKGRDEELAVVPRAHLGSHDSTQLVAHAGDDRRGPAQPQGSGKSIGEPTGEHEVDSHPPGDREINRDDEAEPRGGIENVPMHRGDERQAAEQEGIPLRDGASRLELLGAEEPEGISRDEHVGPGAAEEDLTGKERPEQSQRGEGAGQRGQRSRPARLPRIRFRRHWDVLDA